MGIKVGVISFARSTSTPMSTGDWKRKSLSEGDIEA